MRVSLWLNVFVLVVAVGGGRVALAAGARPQQRDPAKEVPYTAALETADPKLVVLFRAGTEALDARKFPEARAAYEKVLAGAPEHAPTLRRLGYVLQSMGDHKRGIELVRRARELAPGRDGDAALASVLATDGSVTALDEAAELAERMMSHDPEADEASVAAMIFCASRTWPTSDGRSPCSNAWSPPPSAPTTLARSSTPPATSSAGRGRRSIAPRPPASLRPRPSTSGRRWA